MTGAAALARRTALAIGVGLYALLSVYSAADRGGVVPASGVFMVPPLPAQALLAQARQRLAGEDYRGGLALARQAVFANPVEPTAPAMVGAALLGLGEEAGARRAFTVAGRMGWRVPLTQTYWLQEALAVQDYRVAALRFDAMALQNATTAAELVPARQFESSAAGRQALAERLRRAPPWLGPYLDPVNQATSTDLVARAAVAQQLISGGMSLPCGTLTRLLWRLVDVGEARIAQSLWRQRCPVSGGGLLTDGNLARLQTDSQQPFGWQLTTDADVTAKGGLLGGGATGVTFANSAPSRRAVLRQIVVLPAGTYRLTWVARGPAGVASDRIVAAMGCMGSPPTGVPARLAASGAIWSADFPVSAQCSAVQIEFQILPGTADASLSSVSLARVG